MWGSNSIGRLRRLESTLAILILGFGVLFRTIDTSGVAPNSKLLDVGLMYGVLFFLPLGLAIVTLLSAVLAKSTVFSDLTGFVATVMLLGILGSWTMFFFAGGGVQIGHILSFAFGLILAVVVLLKQATLLVFSYASTIG